MDKADSASSSAGINRNEDRFLIHCYKQNSLSDISQIFNGHHSKFLVFSIPLF